MSPPAPPPPDAPPQVLIVDDEATVLRLLSRVVELAGAVPATASSVAEAGAKLAARAFTCVLLDKNLPDGTGLDLLKVIRERHPGTEVILVTGYLNVETLVDALRLGCADYIVKPFTLETVRHRLEQSFARRRMQEAAERMQRQLVQADRMASLGTLAAGLAHEINNPLSYVFLNLDALQQELPQLRAQLGELAPGSGARARELAEQVARAEQKLASVREGTERVLSLSRDLKAYARGDEDTRGPVQIHPALDVAIKMASGEIQPRARLVKAYGAIPQIEGNARRLEQVFLNLLLNAAQAIPAGDPDAHEVRVVTRTDAAGSAVIEVKDSGAGIPPEVRERLFEAFFTTKPAGVGTGLGLSISQGIVNALGGAIEVESAPARGSTFRVLLPALGAPRLVPPAAPTLDAGSVQPGGPTSKTLRELQDGAAPWDPPER